MLLPIVVGSAGPEEVAAVFEPFWDDDATVLLVSSDLSHYLDYTSAQRIDGATCAAIEQLADELIDDEQACGHDSVRGLLLAVDPGQHLPELRDPGATFVTLKGTANLTA